MSDAADPGELVRRAAGGDEDAWLALVDRFASLVWSVARSHRLSVADASDVSQTVWLRLVENLDRLSEPERVAGWLLVTTRRECLRTLRWANRVTVMDGDVVDVRDHRSPPAVGDGVEERERATALWTAVEKLPERCHLLVRLLLLDPPPTYEAIGEALDMPVGSIGPTRSRCFDRLREFLGEVGISGASNDSV